MTVSSKDLGIYTHYNDFKYGQKWIQDLSILKQITAIISSTQTQTMIIIATQSMYIW